jgi:Trk K+ transport system NAD-binding subunit
VRNLGWAGIATGAALALIVRPLNIAAGTYGSDLNVREKLFLCWVAPRGIVAAAGASLVADTLTRAGMPIGNELRAMVFLVIGVTVLVQGLTAGVVASLLGLRLPAHNGYIVLGANPLARAFARVLQHAGEEVVLVESNPAACREAQAEGLRVLHGDGLRESLLVRAEVDRRAGCLAVTSNEAINLLFARRVLDFKVPSIWVALRRGHTSVTPVMVQDIGARVLFSEPRLVDLWMTRLDRGLARIEIWRRHTGNADAAEMQQLRNHHKALLPFAVRRGGKIRPLDESTLFRRGDELYAAIFEERRALATDHLQSCGWESQGCLREAERAEAPPEMLAEATGGTS